MGGASASEQGLAIGLDVGGTRLKAGLVREDGRVERVELRWVDASVKSEQGLVEALAELAAAVDPERRATAVGVGVPGAVRFESGVVTESPNFPMWRDFGLRDRLQTALGGRPVVVDNDANCVVYGAWGQKVRSRSQNVLGFALGTGVGGALVLDGRLHRGVRGMAGEVGRLVVDPGGPDGGLNGQGTLEMYPSVVGLRTMCRAEPVAGVNPDSPKVPHMLDDAAEAGDAVARRHWRAAGTSLGRAIAGYLSLLDLDDVLVVGGVSRAWRWMEDAVWAELRRRMFAAMVADVVIHVPEASGTSDGDTFGVVGAALAARRERHGA